MNEYDKWTSTMMRFPLSTRAHAALTEMVITGYERTPRGVQSFYRERRRQWLLVARLERTGRQALRASRDVGCIRRFWGARRNCNEYATARRLCGPCQARLIVGSE